jgi:glycosyltransferase involved in cell wall biosynthesis
MRILHTTFAYPPEVSGVPEVVSQLSKRLAGMGHEVHVATGLPPGCARHETLDSVDVHRFSVSGSALTGCSGEVDQYTAFVLGGQWDVVAMHCSQIWSTDLLLPHLSQLRCPKVFVAHGLSAFGKRGTESYFESLARALQSVTMVSLARGLEDDGFCARYGLPAPVVIPNGVDTKLWNAPALGVRDRWGIKDRPWLVTVGNHNPLKGHPDFVRLLAGVRKEIPTVAGTIIGRPHRAGKWRVGEIGVKGGCWYQCRLKALLSGNVNLLPNIAREYVVSAVKEADVMICTSNWEASPLAVLEAMAAGTPWVSMEVGSVRDHVGGVMVTSVEAMRGAVVDLLQNPERRKALGREGAERIASMHDWDAIARRYAELYHSISREAVFA